MEPEAVVIAGGVWQKYIVEYLKNKNFKVHVVNPVKTEVTEMADNWIPLDIMHTDKVIDAIRQQTKNLAFITTDQSDVAALPVAKVSKALGTICNEPEVVNLFSNKYEMYKHAASIGVPVPNFTEIKELNEIEAFKNKYGFPFIIKPERATSSRGFAKIEESNYGEINKLYDNCKKYSDAIIAQKYVAGKEVTLEGICSAGKHVTLTSSMKNHFRPGIASSLRYPSGIDQETLEKIKSHNDNFVYSSGLKFGITHSEYMIEEDGTCWLIEIAARGGGCGISSEITPWVTGISNYDILLSNLQGKPIKTININGKENAALLQFFEFPEGYKDIDVDKISKEIKCLGNVHLWDFNFMKKQYLRAATTDQDRHAMAILLATAENEEQIDETLAKIKAILEKERLYERSDN